MTSTYRGTGRIGGPLKGLAVHLPLASGAQMPAMAFGTYRLAPEKAAAAVAFALKSGFRHVDCAPVYGNQAEVGEGLRRAGIRREELFVTSKVWPTQQHPALVEAACRATLRALRVDYLDMYIIHWPVAWKAPAGSADDYFHPADAAGLMPVDPTVALEDTWRALGKLVEAGLVRSIGVSNASSAQIEALATTEVVPSYNQIECHPALAQSALKATHNRLGVVTGAYCPLGMPTRFTDPAFTGIAQHPFLKPLCERTGFSPARLLLNWSLDQNNVVVVKSEREAHILDNAKAQKFALDESVRWMLSHFEDKVLRTRVINPKGFLGKPEPFFAD